MKYIYMLQLGWTLKTLCKEKNPDTKNHIVYNSLYRKYPRKGKSIETVDSQEQSWKYYTYWFQAILQSYINKKNMVLEQKQAYRTMDQNWESENKSTHV